MGLVPMFCSSLGITTGRIVPDRLRPVLGRSCPMPHRPVGRSASKSSEATPGRMASPSPYPFRDARGSADCEVCPPRLGASAIRNRLRACSSVGQSAPLIRVRSVVQIDSGPPFSLGRACPIGRGRSSAGRAPALQAGGHRFDPGRLHHCPVDWMGGWCGSRWTHRDRFGSIGCARFGSQELPVRPSRGGPGKGHSLGVADRFCGYRTE